MRTGGKMIKIEILGTGCPKCTKLAQNAEEAAKNRGIEYVLEKVTNINEIMTYGVMMTPALVLDGTVISSGKLMSVSEIENLL